MKIVVKTEVSISIEDLEKWIRENKTIPEGLNLEKIVNVSLPKEVKFIFSDEVKEVTKIEMTDEEKETFLDTPFVNMEHLLSIRTINCFRAADINTPRDFSDYPASDFKRFKNFGKKSLNEIDRFMKKHGLSIKEE